MIYNEGKAMKIKTLLVLAIILVNACTKAMMLEDARDIPSLPVCNEIENGVDVFERENDPVLKEWYLRWYTAYKQKLPEAEDYRRLIHYHQNLKVLNAILAENQGSKEIVAETLLEILKVQTAITTLIEKILIQENEKIHSNLCKKP